MIKLITLIMGYNSMKRVLERIGFIFIGVLIAYCIYFGVNNTNAENNENRLYESEASILLNRLNGLIIRNKVDALYYYVVAMNASEEGRLEYGRENLIKSQESQFEVLRLSTIEKSVIHEHELFKSIDDVIRILKEDLKPLEEEARQSFERDSDIKKPNIED